jgi:hypothetical protein
MQKPNLHHPKVGMALQGKLEPHNSEFEGK